MNPLSPSQIVEMSQSLHTARRLCQELEPLTKTITDFTLADAYKIQENGIELRLANQEKIIGYKMGLTSKAKMEQMGLHTPIFGVLTDVMEVKNNSVFSLKNKIHPKAEPEIYFITNRDLSGRDLNGRDLQGTLTPEQAWQACERVGVALEILDSRYKGFKYFTLPDVVADNSSSAFFVLGDSCKTTDVASLQNLKIEICENDQPVHTDTSNAILGNPLLSLCELVKLLAERQQILPAGSIVLAGAATAAIELKAEQKISASLEKIGTVSFDVES